MPALTTAPQKARQIQATVKAAEDFDLIVMAAKRLHADQVNGNLTNVREQLGTIGGAHARAIVLEMFLLSTPEQARFLRKTLHFAVDCEPQPMPARSRRALRDLAINHLLENET